MSASVLLKELQVAGVILKATTDGDLELDAPKGVLTEEKMTVLRQYKASLIRLLLPRCPFCGYHKMKQEQSIKEGFIYVDTLCAGCNELLECFVPGKQKGVIEADTAA